MLKKEINQLLNSPNVQKNVKTTTAFVFLRKQTRFQKTSHVEKNVIKSRNQ